MRFFLTINCISLEPKRRAMWRRTKLGRNQHKKAGKRREETMENLARCNIYLLFCEKKRQAKREEELLSFFFSLSTPTVIISNGNNELSRNIGRFNLFSARHSVFLQRPTVVVAKKAVKTNFARGSKAPPAAQWKTRSGHVGIEKERKIEVQ